MSNEASPPIDLTDLQGNGPVWGIASEDLNATLLSWPPGAEVAEHVNEDRDVLLFITQGSGAATLNGQAHALHPAHILLINKGTQRHVRAGANGLRYLSIHLQRGPLQIEPL